jgi:restriction system protein
MQSFLSSSLLGAETRQLGNARWSNSRRVLLALTLLWLPSGLVAVLLISGWRLAGPLRTMLWLAVGVHTLVVWVGWLIVAWQAWQRRRGQPAQDLPGGVEPPVTLGHLLALSPGEFEERAKMLFQSRGYHVVNTPDTADHGIDLLLIDPLGQKGVAQCKRYVSTVGESVVRDLYGTVLHESAALGYLITTAKISQPARLWAQGKPLELIDGDRLVRLINADPLSTL